jgi:hypothetical protein
LQDKDLHKNLEKFGSIPNPEVPIEEAWKAMQKLLTEEDSEEAALYKTMHKRNRGWKYLLILLFIIVGILFVHTVLQYSKQNHTSTIKNNSDQKKVKSNMAPNSKLNDTIKISLSNNTIQEDAITQYPVKKYKKGDSSNNSFSKAVLKKSNTVPNNLAALHANSTTPKTSTNKSAIININEGALNKENLYDYNARKKVAQAANDLGASNDTNKEKQKLKIKATKTKYIHFSDAQNQVVVKNKNNNPKFIAKEEDVQDPIKATNLDKVITEKKLTTPVLQIKMDADEITKNSSPDLDSSKEEDTIISNHKKDSVHAIIQVVADTMQPQQMKKASFKKQKKQSSWTYGLQLNLPILFNCSTNYAIRVNTKLNPSFLYMPELFVGKYLDALHKHAIRLFINPFAVNFVDDRVLTNTSSFFYPSPVDSVLVENRFRISKMVGFGATLQYNYMASSKLHIGLGLNTAFYHNAFVASKVIRTDNGSILSDDMYTLPKWDSTWKYINSTAVFAKVELAYNLKKFSFGTALQLPLSKAFNYTANNKGIINGQLFLRFRVR